MEDIQVLKQLFAEVRSGVNERISEASRQILQFIKTPETAIPILFQLLQTESERTSLVFGAVFLHTIMRKSIKSLEPPTIAQLQNDFCRTIDIVQDLHVKRMLCDDAAQLRIEECEYGPIPQIIIQYLQNEGLATISLYFISQIVINSPLELEIPFITELLPTICELAMNSNRQIRIEAMKLLVILIQRPYMDDIDAIGAINNIINNSVNLCCSNDVNVDEALTLFDLIKISCMLTLDSLEETQHNLLDNLLQIIQSELPMEIRIPACDTYIEALKTLVDEFESELPAIIDRMFEMAVEIYKYDQESDNYKVTDTLIQMLHESDMLNSQGNEEEEEAMNLSDYIFQKIAEYASDESEDKSELYAKILVALSATSSLINVDENTIFVHESEIIDLITNGFALEDENIIDNSADIVSSLCTAVPDNCAFYIGSLTPLLLAHVNFSSVLDAMANLFDNSSIPPPNIEEVITTLKEALSEVPEEMYGDILIIISIALSKSSSSAANFYEFLKDVLLEAMGGNEDLRIGAIKCFSIFISQSPSVVEENLGDILDIVTQSISIDSVGLKQACCDCLATICSIFTESISPYVEQISQVLLSILSMEITQNDEENDIAAMMDESSDNKEDIRVQQLFNLKNSSLSALSVMCVHLPNHLGPLMNEILQYIFSQFDPADNDSISRICSCAVDVIEGQIKIGGDFLHALNFLLESVGEESAAEAEAASVIIESISSILEVGGRIVIEQTLESVNNILLPILLHQRQKWLKSGDVNLKLHQACLGLFDIIVACLGADCAAFSANYMEVLVATASSNKKSNIFAARSLILLCEYSGDANMAQAATDVAIKLISKPSIEIKVTSMQILISSVKVFPQILSSNQELVKKIVEICTGTLYSDVDIALLVATAELSLLLSMNAGVSLSLEILTAFIDVLIEHEKSLPTVAAFALNNSAVHDRLPSIAVLCLSADEYVQRRIREDIKIALAPIAKEAFSTGNIGVLKGNQYRRQILAETLANIQ